jgi:hypothetical protein
MVERGETEATMIEDHVRELTGRSHVRHLRPINQQIILELIQQGSFDQALQLQAGMERLQAAAATSTAADKKLETATYDVGHSYEVLEADLKRATTALEKEAVAATWMAKQATDLDSVLQAMAAHEKAAGAADKAATGTRRAGDASGYGALKWMLLGNAIQDAQYGFEAIVNNVPGIVMAFGGSAGLAGGIGIAAVAAQQLIAHLGDIKAFFGAGLPQKLVYDLKAVQEELQAIDEKPIKSRIDYQDYDIAKRKLDALTEAQQAFDNLKKRKSRETIEAGKIASEAIVEMGGGDDFESSAARVARAAAATKPEESRKTIDARAKRDAAKSQLETATDPDQVLGLQEALARYEQALESSLASDKRNHQQVTEGRVGRAGEGYAGDIKWLQDLIRSNPGAFRAMGVKDSLGQALGEATPAGMAKTEKINQDAEEVEAAGEESIKAVKERFKAIREKEKFESEAWAE